MNIVLGITAGIAAYKTPQLVRLLTKKGHNVMGNVKKYYLLARKHATTDEQRAKMAYLLAKIERNEFYIQTYFSKPDNYGFGADYDDVLVKDWKGFQELRNKYRHTQYYKEVIRECGYFRKTIK